MGEDPASCPGFPQSVPFTGEIENLDNSRLGILLTRIQVSGDTEGISGTRPGQYRIGFQRDFAQRNNV